MVSSDYVIEYLLAKIEIIYVETDLISGSLFIRGMCCDFIEVHNGTLNTEQQSIYTLIILCKQTTV